MSLRALAALAVFASTVLVAPAAQAAPAARASTYRGHGDDVVRIPLTSKPGIVKATYRGESNFIVWAIDTRGKQVGLVANAIGDYKGTRAFNVPYPKRVRALEVTADGSWTLQVLPITKARYWAINAKGVGADVLKLTSPSKAPRRLTIRHRGESNFIVWALDDRGRYTKLLANRIGDYRGRVLLPTGTRYATIEADGPWSIAR